MAELELGPLRFGVVGAGRLGTVIARALVAQGIEVVAASSASADGRERATRRLGVPVFDDPLQVTVDADVVVICVPDDAIPAVVDRLTRRDPHTTPYRLRVLHTSGCASLRALAPLHAAGHATLALHPLQTITDASTPADLRGAAAAITAGDDATRMFGHALAHALGMHPFDLEDAARPLYHCASAFAANYVVTVLGAVEEVTRAAGMHEGIARNAFCALARSAVDRVERQGAAAALTGPIARGDAGTVAAHLAALGSSSPANADLYRALGHATVRLATSGGLLAIDRAAGIDTLLASAHAAAGATATDDDHCHDDDDPGAD